MSLVQKDARKPLRLWPGVVLAVLIVLLRYVLPSLMPDALVFGMPLLVVGVFAGIFGALAIAVWWLLFSRAPWLERLGAVALAIVAIAVTPLVLHESIAGGNMGFMFYLYAIPTVSLGFVGWAAATRDLSGQTRWLTMGATILLASGAWALARTGGISGDGDSDLHWRWTPTPEQRLLAQSGDGLAALPPTGTVSSSTAKPSPPIAATPETSPTAGKEPAAPAASDRAIKGAEGTARNPPEDPKAEAPATRDRGDTRVEWPGFRGPARDSVVRGVRIDSDWNHNPPVELWRRPIGPGWSSFAVHGDLVYTQEQRGEDEVVSAYRLTTGEPVWGHRDAVRFWESNAGAGPRATPTVSNGRVYTLGATGLVNALDARTGARFWSRNAAADTGAELPGWGFTGSPLVVGDVVIVATSGALIGYEADTGEPRWRGPEGGAGYSSPHLATIQGVDQVLLLRGSRTISVAPADGTLLWEHTWQPGVGIVQPALTADDDVLITVGDTMGGLGIRRIALGHGSAGWTVEERWTSRGLKPYFNDFVVHKGHAFGFDNSILSCIDLSDGTRKWKGGRYGSGQMMLLSDQDLLLVLSEDGELALVSATTDKFTEIAKVPAIEGKTWNHPVVVGDIVLVRNGQEMAAFRLPGARR